MSLDTQEVKIGSSYLQVSLIAFIWWNPTNRGDPIFWHYWSDVVLSACIPVVAEMTPSRLLDNKTTQ